MSDAEAKELIAMLKEIISKEIIFPNSGDKKDVSIVSQDQKYLFIMSINRSSTINEKRCSYIVRNKANGKNLLRLDVNGPAHRNPNGERIECPHLHIYKEEFSDGNLPFAIEFDVNDDSLIESCLRFLSEFNVINVPLIIEQNQLFN